MNKIFKFSLILLFGCIFSCSGTVKFQIGDVKVINTADPDDNRTSSSLTIKGSGFGEGGNIIIWDSFESGDDDVSIIGKSPDIGPTEWSTDPYVDRGDITNKYSSYSVKAGNLAYRQHIEADNLGGPAGEEFKEPITMNFGSTNASGIVYLSYFHLYESAGDRAAQVKLPRLTGEGEYNGAPAVGITHQDSVEDSMFYVNYGEFTDDYTTYPETDLWHRYEYFADIDSGFARYDNDHILIREFSVTPDTSTLFGRIALTNVHQMAADTIGVYDYYFDNLYLSDTWARVEIGNNSDWNNCSERTVIPFKSWTDSQIEVNFKSLYVGFKGPYYVFVVDQNNNPSSGYEVNIE